MAVDKTLYTKDSIEHLEPREFVRHAPQMYVGDTTYSTQLFVEAIANAMDEVSLGHCDSINVKIYKDQVMVEDFGQGILVGVPSKEDPKKTILEGVFSVFNTSGKYNAETGVYQGTSLGSYGIGSKLITFLSKRLEVQSVNNGKIETLYFEDGILKNKKIAVATRNLKSGLTVHWQPDPQFFTHPEVDINEVKKLLKTLTCLSPGLIINLDNNGEQIHYQSANGISDLVDEIVDRKPDEKRGSKELINRRFNVKWREGKNGLDLSMTYSTIYSSNITVFVNTGLTSTGPHITALKTALTRELNKFFRKKGWLKEKDDNLTGDDVNEGLCLFCNITSPDVKYNQQIKTQVVSMTTKPVVDAFVSGLNDWLDSNEKDIKIVFDKAMVARKAREAAKKARDAARSVTPKKKATSLKDRMAISDKFVDCSSKDPKKRNLLLVEGTSAAGSAIEARNVETDCIYMLRGKTISPLKTSVDKILANREMADIINIIGAGFGDNFKVEKMEFDKIVITSDQDSDGEAIELLLTTFFYTYMRDLVLKGKLYRAVTPLYIITKGKEKHYCYTEAELDEWRSKHSAGTYDLAHCKGLGEVSAQVLKEICFDNQRFKQITVSDIEATTKLLEVLEGEAVAPRKQYIYDNAERLGFNFL